MSIETKTVEEQDQSADSEQKTEKTSNQNTQEVDYEAELARVNSELSKTQEEKENYRKGMLKAKGKLPAEDDNSGEEDLDAKIDRKVQEKFLNTKEAQIQADKDKLIADMAKKNKELTLALKNRGQIQNSSGQGSNEDKPKVHTDKILSESQLTALRAKGWDDKKIEEFKKNLNKVNEMPK